MKRYERKLKQIGLKRQAHQLRVQAHEEEKTQKEQTASESKVSSAS